MISPSIWNKEATITTRLEQPKTWVWWTVWLMLLSFGWCCFNLSQLIENIFDVLKSHQSLSVIFWRLYCPCVQVSCVLLLVLSIEITMANFEFTWKYFIVAFTWHSININVLLWSFILWHKIDHNITFYIFIFIPETHDFPRVSNELLWKIEYPFYLFLREFSIVFVKASTNHSISKIVWMNNECTYLPICL